MREREAQTVLLVKAFEEADPEGLVLTADDRRLAEEASRSAPDDERAIARAGRLALVLDAKVPGTSALLRGTRIGAGLLPGTLIVAFGAGLASNALGPQKRIDLWQWPFVFLFAWNAVWYAIFLVGPWIRRERPHGPGAASRAVGTAASVAGRGARLAGRLVDAVLSRFTSRARKRDARTAAVVASAVGAYAADWRKATGALLASRTRLLLHAGSLALATGLVVGMYARGLTFQYLATWESTVLTEGALSSMLGALLGPAAAVLRTSVPAVGSMGEVQSAGPWLHLYAVATLLYVAIPRALFLVRESLRERRLAARVPADLSPAYARRAGLSSPGEGARVRWLGYGYHPPVRAVDTLTALLHGAYGSRCEIEHAADLAYGAEASELPRDDATTTLVVSAAQTPEPEVHGAFLLALAARASRTVVVADASPLSARGLDAARIEERRRLWTRVAAEAGVEVAHVDLSAPLDDRAIDRVAELAGVIHPAAATGR